MAFLINTTTAVDNAANGFFTNVGIGTSSPANKLHVVGSSATPSVRIGSSSVLSAYWDIGRENATSGDFLFNNGSTTVMTLTNTGGNLGLGVTPPAWESGTQSITVGSGTALWNPGSGTVTRLITNAFRPTAGNYTYRNNGSASYYEQNGATHAWYNASSGTAGTTITFTRAMTLDGNGSLIVGNGTTAYGKITSEADVNGNNDVWMRNNNTGASSACGYVLNASGNSWRIGMGSSANNSNALTWVLDVTSPSEKMRLTTGGEFYIAGTTDRGAYNLQVNGTGVWGQGAYVNGSDKRMKENIQSLDSGLDVIKKMRAVTFQYKKEHCKDRNIQPGFIAQELQEAMADKLYVDGVIHSGPEYLSVAYQNIIPILVKAIQEQQITIETLETKIIALESS